MRKYLIAFILTIIAMCGITITANAYTFDVYQSDFDLAPIRDKQSLETTINNAFSIATSDYYIDFFYDYNNYYDDYYVRVYFQNDTNSTPSISNNRFYYGVNSNNSLITFQSFKHDNNSVGSWSVYGYGSPFGSYTNNSLSSNYDITVYIIRQSVPCVINNHQFYPPEEYTDEYYANKDGYAIKFGVSPTLNSEFTGTYYSTQNYSVWLSFRKGSTEYNYSIPSLAYINVGKEINITQKENNEYELWKDKPYLSYWKYMRGVRVSKYEYPSSNPPTAESLINVNNTVTFQSDNIITLNQLLSSLNDLNLCTTFTINDLYTDITISFKNTGNQTKFTKVISWSDNHTANDADAEEPPPDEAGIPDQTKDNSENNENLDSNNYYLDVIYKGDTYISNGMTELIQQAPDINNFSVPDYSFVETPLNSDAMGFFEWLVTWWYSTPFGIVAMLALTFLILRVTIWR